MHQLILFLFLIAKAVHGAFQEKSFSYEIYTEYYRMLLEPSTSDEDDFIWDYAHHTKEENERFDELYSLVNSYHFRLVSESVPREGKWSTELLANVSKSRTNIFAGTSRRYLWRAKARVFFKRRFEKIMGRSDARWRLLEQALEKASYKEMDKRLDVLVQASNEAIKPLTFSTEIEIMLRTLSSRNEICHPELSPNPLCALFLRKAVNIYTLFSFQLFALKKNLELPFADPIRPADYQILKVCVTSFGEESVEVIVEKKLDMIGQLRNRYGRIPLDSEVSSYVAAYFQLLCWAMQENPELYDLKNALELEDRTRGKIPKE